MYTIATTQGLSFILVFLTGAWVIGLAPIPPILEVLKNRGEEEKKRWWYM
ncbi:hypothetical protein COCNU_scaffold009479G000060 [Cocos nucifera]|nr:hypothetical protein [Cocos nucifera]